MFRRLWLRLKNWLKQTRLFRYCFGGPQVELALPPVNMPPPPVNTNQCAFTHSQRATMSLMRNRHDTLFYRLPRDVMKHISRVVDADYDDVDSDIAKVLRAVVFRDFAVVKTMLIKNPRLLLEAGKTIDPAGNTILRVTPYECAIGAGDEDMVAVIGEHFARLEDGEKERIRQYERYQEHVDNMLQPTYDFSSLVQAFRDSNANEVQAALNLQFNVESPLHAALEKFRNDFSPQMIKKGMHFGYANFMQACTIYQDGCYSLEHFNPQKLKLFWRQVIGYMQRSLPACGRLAFGNERLRPFDCSQDERIGLGFEYAVTKRGTARPLSEAQMPAMQPLYLWEKFTSNKKNKLKKLMWSHQELEGYLSIQL